MLPRIMRYTGTSPNGIRPPLQPATLQKGAGWSRVDSVSLELPDEGTRRRAFASLSHADLPVCCSADLLLRLRRSCATTTSSTTTTCWTCSRRRRPARTPAENQRWRCLGRRLRPRAENQGPGLPTDRSRLHRQPQAKSRPAYQMQATRGPTVPRPTAACPLCPLRPPVLRHGLDESTRLARYCVANTKELQTLITR